MVLTGMGDANALEVEIRGDGSDLANTLDSAERGLLSLKNVVGGLSAVLAGAGVAGFAAATSAAAEYEEALVEVEKVTNPETAREMGDAIREMAATMPVAQQELAAIAADAGRFGVEGSENIEAFTETVSRMSVATDLSADQAGEAFARLAALTNTPIDEMENLGSAINTLSNNFATSSSEIVDSMLRSSAALSQLGLTQQEMVGLSASLNAVSESSERAGTRLRRLAQELLDPRKTEDLARALGMNVAEFERIREEAPLRLLRRMARAMAENGDGADALRRTLSTTSQQALSGLAQNLDGVNRALDLSTQSYAEATSLQKEYDAASETFNAKLQITRNRLFNIAETTGSALLPALSDLLEDVNGLIGTFQDFNEATDGVAGSAATAGSAIIGLGGAAAWFAGGPAGLLVGATAAIGFAFATDFLNIRTIVMRTMEDVGETIARVLEDSTDKTNEELGTQVGFWEKWGSRVSGAMDRVAMSIAQVIDNIGTTIELVRAVESTAQMVREGDLTAAEGRRRLSRRVGEIRSTYEQRREERLSALEARGQERAAFRSGEVTVIDAAFTPGQAAAVRGQGRTPAGRTGASAAASEVASEYGSAAEAYASAAKAYRESTSAMAGRVPGASGIRRPERMGLPEGSPRTPEELQAIAGSVQGELRPSDFPNLSKEEFNKLLRGESLPAAGTHPSGFRPTAGSGSVSASTRAMTQLPQAALAFQNAAATFETAVQMLVDRGIMITVDDARFDAYVQGQIRESQNSRADRYGRATGHTTGSGP